MAVLIRPIGRWDKSKIDDLFLSEDKRLNWDYFEFLNHPDCFASVAVDKNCRVIGFGSLTRCISARHGKIGRIEDILVHRDFRGNGYARKITEYLNNLGKKLKLRQNVLTSKKERIAARALYESLGFKFVKETGVFVKNLY